MSPLRSNLVQMTRGFNLKLRVITGLLKLVSAIFFTNFYFSPNVSSSKSMKYVFYFIQKALFVLEIFKYLYFHLPLFFSLSAIALELDPR